MIRVVIERWLLPGNEDRLIAQLREMRGDALHAPGYVSGETLRDVADPLHLIIFSTWLARHDWDTWASSAMRHRVLTATRPMLASPEKVTVLEPV